MFTYQFGVQVNMLTFSTATYTGGTVIGFTSTQINVADLSGDSAVITGTGFAQTATGVSGTVTGVVLKNSSSATELTGTSLSLSLAKLYADRSNAKALFSDLFDSGVQITGSSANDILLGGKGNDTLLGGNGNDTLIGAAGDDTLDGGAGVNTASYQTTTAGVTVSLALTGFQNTVNAGSDKLINIQNITGSNFADTLTGNAGANTLYGGGAADHLIGGGGNDRLVGGAGVDTLTGGSGNVQFVYNAVSESTPTSADLITDFHTGDKINLSAIDADTVTAGHQSFHLGATAGHTGDVVVSTYDPVKNHTAIRIYVNSDTTPDAFIFLTGDHHALTLSDFVGVTSNAPTAPAAATAGATQRFASAMAGFGAGVMTASHVAAQPLHSAATMLLHGAGHGAIA